MSLLVEGGIRIAADANLDALEDTPAVFVLHPREGGAPYVAKTNRLRRRLRRLLGESRWQSLRGVVESVEYWPTASRLAMNLSHYALARRYYPDSYLQRVKLRFPAYVKLLAGNPFPRTQVTTRLSSPPSVFYGPFRSRAAAEEFEKGMLDQFQLRRCQEDLAPSPDHPGCIYGEMAMCLRPCQEMVGESEYATEAERVREFLASNGESLVLSIERARDRASENLDFEEAARQHQRRERVEQLRRAGGELAFELSGLEGVAVNRAPRAGVVELRFFRGGAWLPAVPFALEGAGQSMDSRLREIAAQVTAARLTLGEKQEHTALLARWFYSSWRDGEWLNTKDELPYRKLVRAIARVAAGS